MVGKHMERLLVLTAVLLIPAFHLTADGALSMELSINNLILQTRETVVSDADPLRPEYSAGDSFWSWITAGSAGFSFKSEGDRNVKADLAFSFLFPETVSPVTETAVPSIGLDRAYVKARFPWFRLTAGKTRLDWGEGFVFNSGDLIFGSTDTTVDLTAAEVRTDTKWLTALNIPIGRFSFIEGVVLPPLPDFTAGPGRLDETSAGGRVYTKFADIKIEAGYLFDQDDTDANDNVISLHKLYLALQGNLFADWYVSSSTALPVSGELSDRVKDSLSISAGLFHLISLNSISSFNLRFEGLYKPFHSWKEAAIIPEDTAPVYALLLYPEIGWSPTDTVSLSLRSVFSPVDLSAMITAGGSWNVFEGFDLSCYCVFNAGDSNDTFSWKKDKKLWIPGTDVIDGSAAVFGITYIY